MIRRSAALLLILALLAATTTGPANAASTPATPPTQHWRLVAQDDFRGPLAPHWSAYHGTPACCAQTDWAAGEVTDGAGKLVLSTTRTAQGWVTGGVSAAGWPAAVRTYGLYVARIRVDRGIGISAVALLWPAANSWPPELDYYEVSGADGDRTRETATDHRAGDNAQLHSAFRGDLTQWHTIDLAWLPDSITYTVDGHRIGQITDASYIPHQPMWPAFQMQVGPTGQYNSGEPTTTETGPVTMQISWFAVYAPLTATAVSTSGWPSGLIWLGAAVVVLLAASWLVLRRRGRRRTSPTG